MKYSSYIRYLHDDHGHIEPYGIDFPRAAGIELEIRHAVPGVSDDQVQALMEIIARESIQEVHNADEVIMKDNRIITPINHAKTEDKEQRKKEDTGQSGHS